MQPGLRTTVQDNGRRHHQQHGLAVGGAADRHGFRWANKLVDNPPDAACLEILLGGFEACAEGSLWLAITGAEAELRINGEPMPLWTTHYLGKGDRITLGRPVSGMLNYIAVKEGWQTEPLFGSRSAVVREQFDRMKPLDQNDRVAAGKQPKAAPVQRRVPVRHRPDYTLPLTLRLLPGYQFNEFSTEDRRRLLSNSYTIGARSDRMGYRLEGEALTSGPSGIISEGIALGSVQIPGDGQPIVLLDDRQTIGGYAKIGTVAAADCSQLVQRPPGARVSFALADIADIQAERMLAAGFFTETQWLDDGRRLAWKKHSD